MENQNPTIVILICCEGQKTEPDYFKAVIKQRRINQGRARVTVVGDKGQHKALINHAVVERKKICKQLDLDPSEIEVWAVCDKDTMSHPLSELEDYANQNSVKVAFTDPRFEVFLLQHFVQSATNETGRKLEAMLAKAMSNKGVKKGYQKADLAWMYTILDAEPLTLERAIKNSRRIASRGSSPYTTVHILLERLLNLAP